MDLSKIPTEDLQAIQAGNWEKVSTPGLQAYQEARQHDAQAATQAQNPQNQTLPDPAQKVSQPPGQQYLSPGESATNNFWTNVKDRITDPNRWKAVAMNQGPAKTDVVDGLGAAGLSLPMEAAPEAVQSLATYLGKSGVLPGMARIGASTVQGAATGAYNDENDRAGGAKVGAAIGLGLGTLGEGINGGIRLAKWVGKGLSRMSGPQSDAYLADPKGTQEMAAALQDQSKMPALQDQAVEAINTSRGVLKRQGLANASALKQQLSGKTISINPEDYYGLDPRVDELLEGATRKSFDAGPSAQTSQGQPAPSSKDIQQFAEQIGLKKPSINTDYRQFAETAGLTPATPTEESLAALGGRGPNTTPATEPVTNAAEVAYEKSKMGLGSPNVDVDANVVNQIKRYLQEGANFAQGTVTDPVQAAKVGMMAQKAAGLRAGIEQVAPEAADLNKSMQDGLMLQKALRQGAKNSPLAFVGSEAPDRVATLARAENAGAGGLLDFGSKLGAAKTMTKPDTGSGVPTFLNRLAGRGLMRAADAVDGAVPLANQDMMQGLFSKKADQK